MGVQFIGGFELQVDPDQVNSEPGIRKIMKVKQQPRVLYSLKPIYKVSIHIRFGALLGSLLFTNPMTSPSPSDQALAPSGIRRAFRPPIGTWSGSKRLPSLPEVWPSLMHLHGGQ